MADYKMIDAEKLDADLKSVADSIRSVIKSANGYTYPYHFPDDFCDEIIHSKDLISNSIHNQYANKLLTEPYSTLSVVYDFTYAGMTRLKSAEFTEYASIIGNYAFYDCNQLELERLPDSIKKIGIYAFFGCIKLTLSKIPEGTTEISPHAFEMCRGIITLLMPEVVKIGYEAFFSCSSLTEVTIKRKCESIDNYAFRGCINLTTINVPWSEGEVANAPWGATNATINYNYTGG